MRCITMKNIEKKISLQEFKDIFQKYSDTITEKLLFCFEKGLNSIINKNETTAIIFSEEGYTISVPRYGYGGIPFMAKWFYSQNFLVQLILLLIPGVNWIIEIGVRWSAYFKTHNLITLLFAILVTIPSGIVIGWLDLIWLLLFRHLIFADI